MEVGGLYLLFFKSHQQFLLSWGWICQIFGHAFTQWQHRSCWLWGHREKVCRKCYGWSPVLIPGKCPQMNIYLVAAFPWCLVASRTTWLHSAKASASHAWTGNMHLCFPLGAYTVVNPRQAQLAFLPLFPFPLCWRMLSTQMHKWNVSVVWATEKKMEVNALTTKIVRSYPWKKCFTAGQEGYMAWCD